MNSRAPGITFGFTRVNSILERNKRAVGETFVGREQCAQGMPCRVSLMHFNGSDTHEISRILFLSDMQSDLHNYGYQVDMQICVKTSLNRLLMAAIQFEQNQNHTS